MRSFRSKVLSAVACVPAVLAAALPARGDVARPYSEPVQLDFQQNYARATFSVPFGQAHTDQDDESLVLNFTAHSHDAACGSANITINGVPLPQEWEGDHASGSGSYQYSSLDLQDEQPQRDLGLAWNSTCLHGSAAADEAAQILTVNIKSIDGVPINTPAGFTISFRQNTSPPALLRLETVPDLTPELTDVWRDPPVQLRLVTGPAPSLEDEIRELRALQAELEAIQKAVATKKQHINSQIRKEAKCFTADLKQCDSLSCVLKTVAGKAHGAWRMVYLRLHTDPETDTMGRPEVFASAHLASQRYGSINVASDVGTDVGPTTGSTEAVEAAQPTPRPYEATLPPRPQQRQPPYIIALEIALGVLCCGCLTALIRHKCASLRTRTERLADHEERQNTRAYKRAARRHAWRAWWRGTGARRDAARTADYEEKRALIADQEGVLEDAMQEEIRQLRVAHGVVHDIIRAEEGRTANPPLGSVGHARCTCQQRQQRTRGNSAASTHPPTSIPEAPSRPSSRADSLPSYRSRASEPPSYEAELASSFMASPYVAAAGGAAGSYTAGSYVANGFASYDTTTRYAPSESGRWTPDSSVVDVSPRPSAETLRWPVSVFTVDSEGESESEGEA
ncbi:hypothetical protein C7974DRAFT_191269 [Boeremia exigua]|uniref:uncharacterized protein n=1 Tax=Boeremia exigua TaxID=749465 RepID=UPI001E8E59ED|nr:uncharacterized protein C7974DRAFT_191269 [Boeremia exigua]KAH6629713.1 hypothetical protein C7974DRAFT_191269 [Boeremia exigua]